VVLFNRTQRHSEEFVYEIKPTNFGTLPDDKKMAALGRFLGVLTSIQRTVRILMIKDPLDLQMGNETKSLHIPRTYLVAEERLEQLLHQTGLEYSMATDRPRWRVAREHLTHLVLGDKSLARCYTLYRLPSTLGAAWAHSLLSHVDMISIRIRPIESQTAVSAINRYVGLLGASELKNPASRYKYEKGLDVLQALARQETRLFKCSLVVMVRSKDAAQMKLVDRHFKMIARSSLASFEATPTMQGQMIRTGAGKDLYFELGSCAIFYPFVSADMIEIPNGVALGLNMNTMAPVVFDYSQRDNYNILLLATSGAGKSVTAKTLLARLIKKYPTSEVFVVDPNGEYEAVANFLQIPIIKVTEGQELGLDPFNLFRPEDAAEIIGDISKGDEVVRKEFRAKAGHCKSIKDLYDRVDERAKNYLKDLVAGSLYDMLRGEMRIGGRVVISLRGTSGEERISMLLLLVLGKIWKQIHSLPASVPKILLVDEGWMLFNMSSAGKFLDMMARMGRKFNVIFIFVTQRPEDVIENRFGRAIAENAATKIFLQNTEQASERIQHTMGLSEEEAEMLKTFSRGQCLLLTKDYRLKVQITPSNEELKVFSTTPMDV
jgi:hypothetical protein